MHVAWLHWRVQLYLSLPYPCKFREKVSRRGRKETESCSQARLREEERGEGSEEGALVSGVHNQLEEQHEKEKKAKTETELSETGILFSHLPEKKKRAAEL